MDRKMLTAKQKQLRAQIEEISSIISMDHWNISNYEQGSRTVYLEKMKNQLVRSEIVLKYTLVDELLTSIICHYFFKKTKQNQTFRRLWRTKRFVVFNHYLMDEVFLLGKLRVVRGIKDVPRKVRENIERINALRNALAHSFFPENRRQYMTYKKVVYRGVDIYTKDGIEKFEEDSSVVIEYLMHRAFGGR